jgi:hypothetical protein
VRRMVKSLGSPLHMSRLCCSSVHASLSHLLPLIDSSLHLCPACDAEHIAWPNISMEHYAHLANLQVPIEPP